MRFIYTKIFQRLFILFIAVAALIILDATGISGIIKTGFINTYGSAQAKARLASNSVKQFFSTLFIIKNLAKENAVLSHRIDELAFENARLQSAKVENLTLRKALNFEQNSSLNLIPVEVKTSDPTGFTQIITIDKGSSSGIKLNGAVIVAPGLLVGKVTKVFTGSSEVTLLTDPEVVVNGQVSESQARGLVKGEHGLGLIFGLITQNELIKVGDKVVTSGLANDFPKGLLIGEITAVRSGASDLFQSAFITPAADLRNLRFLFIIE